MLIKPRKAPQQRTYHSGFTLIETIVGIVVLAIAFSIMTTLIFPLANQNAEQVHQIKAAELGQSMINEILGRAFDEHSDMSGGLKRCGEGLDIDGDGAIDECSIVLGNEEGNNRALFDDVDDYNGLEAGKRVSYSKNIENSLGESLYQGYIGFSMSVEVVNDSDYDGDSDAADNNYSAKLITITITTPQEFDVVFSFYKANF